MLTWKPSRCRCLFRKNMNSDISEEEDNDYDNLKEAVDSQFLKDCFYNNNEDKPQTAPELPPSLRKSKQDEKQFNLYGISEGTRDFLARKLSLLIDHKLELKNSKNKNKLKRKSLNIKGIKLLSDSKEFIEIGIEHNAAIVKPRVKQRKIDKLSLKEIVISGEEVLSLKGTEYWTERRKSTVFNYKRAPDGQLTLINEVTY